MGIKPKKQVSGRLVGRHGGPPHLWLLKNISGTSYKRYQPKDDKNFDSQQTIVYNRTNFPKEVIPGASFRGPYAQEVLKPRCPGGLGKARFPETLDKAGKDRLGNGLLHVSFCSTAILSFFR
jgi:hypothetical protein